MAAAKCYERRRQEGCLPILCGGSKHFLVPLGRGYFAKVDLADWGLIRHLPWRAAPQPNGVYVFGQNNSLHRFLTNAPSNYDVDHINGDPLDNRRKNLRVVSHAVNMRNQKVRSTSKTGVRGVSFEKYTRKYKASFKIGNRVITLGRFSSLADATKARRDAELLHWNEVIAIR